ncbi:putative transcriptional regulator containing an HTH domain and an uncharacterized domain shared with the mammalian protein Schlafen [Bifidobacterium reuteri DSM 23975]|uniref:Putative transcriptional regulator containing an HTH domain and an uncharacterized domain shared with the mammalian protein Schlafen n=1 Tax=Bifidobacterium reuteri DSM 23975 TaxID=1437610 RepID=A0A087CMC5_9BIFI|nr:putative transcriptional regulator containing an HTH domain and an uncharacterized domain shared with the mammalian protein Schlafen [Bifidobacterium reuteri DSM 23975]
MLLPHKESIRVEFKSERTGPVDDSVIINNMVAFANTQGGTLYLGIEDDGTVTGVSKKHRNINQLAAYVFNNTVPPVQVRPSVINDSCGLQVVSISVDESQQLICTKGGRVIQRVLKADGEPENVTMYPYEFISRLSGIGQYDYSAQPAPDSSLNDLDGDARNMLREGIARTHADDQLLALADAEFDGATGLVTRDIKDGIVRPSVAGIVTIGTHHALRRTMPTATATFQVMRDGSPVVDETLRLPLVAMLARIEELLAPWNTQTEVMLGPRHAVFYDIDRSAFREAMVNAFCHRDYTLLGPVRFQMDEAGLTIANPGGFMRGVSFENLLTVSPTPRNRQLADVLKRCGYVERTGRGIDRIFARTVAAGRPLPDYSQSTPDEVVLFFRKAKVDEGFVRMVDALTEKRRSPLPVESLIVVAALNQYGTLTDEDIAFRTSIDRERVQMALDDLRSLDAIEGNGNRYALVEEKEKDAGDPVILNTRSYQERCASVLDYIRQAGGATSVSQMARHFGVSYATASRLLKRMQDDGMVRRDGAARSSRYSVA